MSYPSTWVTDDDRLNALEREVAVLRRDLAGLPASGGVAEYGYRIDNAILTASGSIEARMTDILTLDDKVLELRGDLDAVVPTSTGWTGPGTVTVVHNNGYMPIVQVYDGSGNRLSVDVIHISTNRFHVTVPSGIGEIIYA